MLKAIKKTLNWCVVAIVSACILTFTANNFQKVDISLFPFSYEVSIRLYLMVLVCFALGVITGGLLMSMQSYRWRRQAKTSRARSEVLENEIKSINAERIAARSEAKLPAAIAP